MISVWITDQHSKISYEARLVIEGMHELGVLLTDDGTPITFLNDSLESTGGIFVKGILPDCLALWWDGSVQLSTGPDATLQPKPPKDVARRNTSL